jgi:hypothetical protein
MAKQQRRLASGALESDIFAIALADIDPDPQQPRQTFSESRLLELSESFSKDRVRFPITVRAHPEFPGRFLLIKGERRWRAAKRAGLTRLPVILEYADDLKALEMQLTAIVMREDVHHLERGAAAFRLLSLYARDWNLPLPLENILELMAAQDRQEPAHKRKSRADDAVLVFIAEQGPRIRGLIKLYARSELRHFFQSVVQMRLRAPDVFKAAITHNLGVRVTSALATVQDPVVRAELTTQAASAGWSHSQTKRAVLERRPKPKTLGDERLNEVQRKEVQQTLKFVRDVLQNYNTYDQATQAELNPLMRKMKEILERHKSADMSAKNQ